MVLPVCDPGDEVPLGPCVVVVVVVPLFAEVTDETVVVEIVVSGLPDMEEVIGRDVVPGVPELGGCPVVPKVAVEDAELLVVTFATVVDPTLDWLVLVDVCPGSVDDVNDTKELDVTLLVAPGFPLPDVKVPVAGDEIMLIGPSTMS